MGLGAALGVAISSLLAYKGRAALTGLGITVGIGLLTALVSAGEGAREKLDGQLETLGKNIILIRPGQQAGGTEVTLTRADAAAIRREVGSLVVGVSMSQVSLRTASTMAGNWPTTFTGTTPEVQPIRHWTLVQGRFFTEEDVKKETPVCLLGQTVRQRLFPGKTSPLGEWVRADHLRLQVIGVLGAKGRALTGFDQDDQIFLPVTTLQHKLVGQERLTLIFTAARSDDLVEPVKEKVARALQRQHGTPVGDDFEISSIREMAEIAYVFTQALRLLVAVIAGISLIVGGVGILNIMLVSVTERTPEIGIRLALGARPADILNQFLLEAVAVALLGGLPGVLVGLVAAEAIAAAADWPLVISPGLILLATGLTTAVGVCSGYYPAWKASRLEPIEALHAV